MLTTNEQTRLDLLLSLPEEERTEEIKEEIKALQDKAESLTDEDGMIDLDLLLKNHPYCKDADPSTEEGFSKKVDVVVRSLVDAGLEDLLKVLEDLSKRGLDEKIVNKLHYFYTDIAKNGLKGKRAVDLLEEFAEWFDITEEQADELNEILTSVNENPKVIGNKYAGLIYKQKTMFAEVKAQGFQHVLEGYLSCKHPFFIAGVLELYMLKFPLVTLDINLNEETKAFLVKPIIEVTLKTLVEGLQPALRAMHYIDKASFKDDVEIQHVNLDEAISRKSFEKGLVETLKKAFGCENAKVINVDDLGDDAKKAIADIIRKQFGEPEDKPTVH